MIGEDAESIEATTTYLDYVKTWTVKTDRGGLVHVSNDCFRFFCAVEEVTYEKLEKGSSRAEFITELMDYQTVRFYWDIIDDWRKIGQIIYFMTSLLCGLLSVVLLLLEGCWKSIKLDQRKT